MTTWNLSHLFNGDDDPKIAETILKMKEATQNFESKWRERTDYLEDPKILFEALTEYEKLFSFVGKGGKVGYYWWLRSEQEQDNTEISAQNNKFHDVEVEIQNKIQFFEINLSKAEEQNQNSFLESSELKEYKHYLEKVFESGKYILTEKEEKILNLRSKTAKQNWVKMVETLLSKEERDALTEEEKTASHTLEMLLGLCNSSNEKVRIKASEGVNSILDKYAEVAEHEINSVLEYKKVSDELRGFERPDTERHIADDIETEVVDTLVSSVSSRFDISKRFYELKANLLGKPKLEYYERGVSIGNIDREFSYEESCKVVDLSFKKLDQEFSDIFHRFQKDGQIDVYPKKGKGGGAFCAYTTKACPTYILLNHTGKIRDVKTLAHELGHGINDELMRCQNELNFHTSTATAEVASTFMEDFALQELLSDVDEEIKFSIMLSRLNDEMATIFRQIACYKFEQDLHKEFRNKGYLSKEEIGKIFRKNMESYFGDAENCENWWVYWSHIRTYFYVYSYSSGLLISKALQSMVKEDPSTIEKVKDFFRAGSSKSPKQIFLDLGVDITDTSFWNKGLDEIENLLLQVENLAKKLGKI